MKYFSIVLPIYNMEKYIKECIDSILMQNYDNYEIIIIDNGSTDNSLYICKDYESKNKSIKLVHEDINVGVAEVRNIGMRMAVGDYIIFIDSDDFWIKNDFLSKINIELKKSNIDILFFECIHFYDDQKIWGKVPKEYELLKNNHSNREDILNYLIQNDLFRISPWSKVIKRKLLIENHIEFKKGILCEDIDFILQVIFKARTIATINYPAYAYRVRYGNGGSTGKLTLNKDCDEEYRIMTCKFRYDVINSWCEKIKNASFHENTKYNLFGFMGFQYYILIGEVSRIKNKKERNRWFLELKNYDFLLHYKINKKTYLSSILCRLFGIKIAAKLFSFYMVRIKPRYIK